MLYFAIEIARKLHLLPASKHKLATRQTEVSDNFATGEPGLEDPSWPSDIMHFGSTCSGTPHGPMTCADPKATATTIAGGNYTPASTMNNSEVARQQRGQCRGPAMHPAMCELEHPPPSGRPRNTDVATQYDQNSVPKDADLDVESLGNHLEAFITKQSTKLIKKTKELLPGALDAAIQPKLQSMEKDHQTSLQQAKEQAARESRQLTESFQQQLYSKDQNLASLSQKLADTEQHCTSLQTTITSKKQENDDLRAELARKNTEIQNLHVMVDDAEHELDHVRCRGRELLTYQGLSTPQANLSTLRVASKDLSTSCDRIASLIRQHNFAYPLIPLVVDLERALQNQQQKQQVNMSGLRHTIWNELFGTVLVEFRQSQLVANCGIHSEVQDEEALILQLQLEKKLADHWLQLTTQSTSDSAAESSIDKYTNIFMTKLLGNGHMLRWDMSRDPTPVLTPAARQLVAAAMNLQIIASAMHSQLIRVVVPGWLQDLAVPSSPEIPASWAEWPGVVPFSKDWMQAGAALPAATFALPSSIEAAVLCQEPAVVQLAERVNDLPEFGGQPQQGAYKVLVKARMVVARCM